MKTLIAFALSMACAAAPADDRVNVLDDGDFEGDNADWAILANSLFGDAPVCEASHCALPFMASSGTRYALLAGGSLTQNSTGLARYRTLFGDPNGAQLQFDWATLGSGPAGAPCPRPDDGLEVWIDDQLLWANDADEDCVNVFPYQTVVLDLQGLGVTGGAYTIEFRAQATGASGLELSAVYLDNVRLITEPDTDGDGIADTRDNCVFVPNASQCDGDGDGYGNGCDADFNNDCVVNGVDLALFRLNYFSTNPIYDLNCDGIVNTPANRVDLGQLRNLFFSRPGPSGLTNACDPGP